MKRFLTIFTLLSLLLSSCEEKVPDLSSNIPKVIISEWSCDGSQTFVFKASVLSQDVVPVEKCGFYCSDNGAMQGAENYPSRLTGSTFSAEVNLAEMSRPYHVCAYISNGRSEICSESVVVEATWDEGNFINLSSLGSANCYIVSQSGTYKFKPVKGNSPESVGQVASAEVLWETFGTSESPSKGDLIRNVSYSNGFVKFSTADTFREGNALLAARDASGNILWSWHIWLTDQPKGQTYNNGAGVMMDRNLGATSATPGDVGALGLLYQWGRKDPFLNSSLIRDDIEAESTITWPSPMSSSSSTGTISFATSHPTTFITRNSNNNDWYYTGSSSTDNTRWQSSKTIYDPCPAGWRVSDGGDSGVWSKAFGTSSRWETSSNWDYSNKGMDFSKTDKKLGSSGPIWYPASGYRTYSSSGALGGVGSFGYYWSVSPYGMFAYYVGFSSIGGVYPASGSYRASGHAVRCLQE